MTANDVYFENHEDIISNEKVIDKYTKIVASYNEFLNPTEQVKKFDLLANEWGIDTGEMTPKLSMKRKVIMEKYQSNISSLFQ
jgi:long-chain acyl-CoA synthetase